jgi:hypothetical protein
MLRAASSEKMRNIKTVWLVKLRKNANMKMLRRVKRIVSRQHKLLVLHWLTRTSKIRLPSRRKKTIRRKLRLKRIDLPAKSMKRKKLIARKRTLMLLPLLRKIRKRGSGKLVNPN